MEKSEIEQNLKIIKNMVLKNRNQTLKYGNNFVIIGISCLIATLLIGFLELNNYNRFTLPVIVLTVVINIIVGFIIGGKEDREEVVSTYAQDLFWNIWIICGFASLMVVFVFPFIGTYEFRAVPVLISVIMGILMYLIGVVYELTFLRGFSAVWFIGAVAMALNNSVYGFFIMAAIQLFGWIIPGFMLKALNKKMSVQNEA